MGSNLPEDFWTADESFNLDEGEAGKVAIRERPTAELVHLYLQTRVSIEYVIEKRVIALVEDLLKPWRVSNFTGNWTVTIHDDYGRKVITVRMPIVDDHVIPVDNRVKWAINHGLLKTPMPKFVTRMTTSFPAPVTLEEKFLFLELDPNLVPQLASPSQAVEAVQGDVSAGVSASGVGEGRHPLDR